MRILFLLIFISSSAYSQRALMTFARKPEANQGYNYLIASSKIGWLFTGISGGEGDAITSVASVAGTSNPLTNNSGGLSPKIGFTQIETSLYSGLRASTASGTSPKEAMITNNQPDTYFQSDFEVDISFVLIDGQGSDSYLLGVANGGTQRFDVAVNTSGNIVIRMGAAASLSTFTATGNSISNNYTGIVYLRLRADFTTDVLSIWVNGVPLSVALTSGGAFSTINPANFSFGVRKLGVGGSWDGAFTADGLTKIIHKLFITPLKSGSNALYVSEYMTEL